MHQLTRFPFLIFFCVLIFLFSCKKRNTQQSLSKAEMIAYISSKENGLSEVKLINETEIKLSYQPSSLLAAQELEGEQWKDAVFLDSVEKKYSGNYYFILKFSKNGKEAIRQLGDFSRYSDMVQVFSFGMNKFVNLTTTEKDTVGLADFFFDQNYGIGDGNSILLSFEKGRIKNSKEVEINVAECGLGVGNLKFNFDKKKLDNIPKLDFSRLEN